MNFRSVADSGWIECDNVTTLVGINEAGKSNLLVALWRLKPAQDGEIDILRDMPIKEYSSWRDKPDEFVFITAEFSIDDELCSKIEQEYDYKKDYIKCVRISRRFSGKYDAEFPDFHSTKDIDSQKIRDVAYESKRRLDVTREKTKSEEGIKIQIEGRIRQIMELADAKRTLDSEDFSKINKLLDISFKESASSEIKPFLDTLKTDISEQFTIIQEKNPAENADLVEKILEEMPSFVYYSNYGNLDSEIYLPHATKLLKGEEVPGVKNEAKVRTLRVLFDFVKLNPEEILNLGKDPVQYVRDIQGRITTKQATPEEIEEISKKKTERSILLQSAGTDLTRQFKDWWKQGGYIFRFQADGEYFKIWVSDDKRPEEVELERRSTGLQWFLSFYLVFLVESKLSHKGAIVLLDEAGLSLHPLAQRDLALFFDNLSKSNQIIHTTHSPFLVNTSNIDRVKVVYMDSNGMTVASSDLRASSEKQNEKSIYAVHAALGLSVSDILLQGCHPIIVEGASDQYYLNALKIHLIKERKINPDKEIVFVPSGGVKGIAGVAGIVSTKDNELPHVILDSDRIGKDAKKKLESGLYKDSKKLLIEVASVLDFDEGEVEDLIPIELIVRSFAKMFRDVDQDDLENYVKSSLPIIRQLEEFSYKTGLNLYEGWKVDMSRDIKQRIMKNYQAPEDYVEKWQKLFSLLGV